MLVDSDQCVGSQITIGQRKWMIKLLHPFNALVECIDRKKGELSYYLIIDKEPVDKDSAYKIIKIQLLHLFKEHGNEKIAFGVYKLSGKGMRTLAVTADRAKEEKLLRMTSGQREFCCISCKRHLYIKDGFNNTSMCGPCATGKVESVYDIGLTW